MQISGRSVEKWKDQQELLFYQMAHNTRNEKRQRNKGNESGGWIFERMFALLLKRVETEHFTDLIFMNQQKKNGFVKNAKKTSNKLWSVLDVIKIRREKYVKIANTGYKRGNMVEHWKHYIDIMQQWRTISSDINWRRSFGQGMVFMWRRKPWKV